jgi:hypothetical protein
MSIRSNLVPYSLSPRQIRSYINFDGGTEVDLEGTSQSRLQSQGVAALWQLLELKNFAYLGDEVGMGKTRQAMGVIATQFLKKPESHVVIVCPGETLQNQWLREWGEFMRTCYKGRDDRLKSAVDGAALHTLHRHERLHDFAKALLLNESHIHLLRYSSFSRPIWFGSAKTLEDVKQEFEQCLTEIGISQISEEERSIFNKFPLENIENWQSMMTADLNECYAKRVGELFRARGIDLVVFDEAQYLRNIGNRQNKNIRHIFRHYVHKWLFMSATPLHSGHKDIQSLDHYLCDKIGDFTPGKNLCSDCQRPEKCTRATYRLEGKSSEKIDVVDLLKEFLVRRPRSYQDHNNDKYSKVQYRKYKRSKIAVAKDPFLALTMALVQKHLVKTLEGGNNKFRQGECSSFESLSSSVKGKRKCLDKDDVSKEEPELEKVSPSIDMSKQETTLDRSFIDALNKSFRAAMLSPATLESRHHDDDADNPKYDMPHAKLNEMASSLFQSHLRNSSNSKALVFVRRLDTVEELIDLLSSQFQDEVDRRLELWLSSLQRYNGDTIDLRESLWSKGEFWTSHNKEDDVEQEDDLTYQGTNDGSSETERVVRLPYFDALRTYKKKDKEEQSNNLPNGMLSSFQSRLLRVKKISGNPFQGFLLIRPDFEDAAESDATEIELAWKKADNFWETFVMHIVGQSSVSDLDEKYQWLVQAQDSRNDVFWKLAALKGCILHSMRHTDFLVDLYVINRYVKKINDGYELTALPEKLLWLFKPNREQKLEADLEEYIENWRIKFKLWFDHFDMVVDKCLRGEDAKDWKGISEKVGKTFARMIPVVGRSGRLTGQGAITQFKFPVHPNIMICTDVLKEGVDLHLFCDEVVHYGVAWTSGDLEQRIGRVDRFGSMISRKIERYRGVTEGALPRLQVEFPYLDGTLDKYQVDRVVNEKIKSDLRMDLGKKEDEIGIISLDELDAEELAPGISMRGTVPEIPLFYPVPDDTDSSSVVAPIAKVGLVSQHLERWFSNANQNIIALEVKHAPYLNSMRVRRNRVCRKMGEGSETNLLRISYPNHKPGKNIDVEEEFLVPIELAHFVDLSTVMRETEVSQGLTQFEKVGGFIFCPQWRTLVRDIRINSPFEGEVERCQTVLLERIGSFWLLRTPVIHHDGYDARWLATQNSGRTWGYLAAELDIIWFVVFVLRIDGIHNSDVLASLAERVGRIGDRLQHLHTASDEPDNWGYRSKKYFPNLSGGWRNGTLATLVDEKEKIMTFMNDELGQLGQLMFSVQTWFHTAFEDVLASLYGGIPQEAWSLTISPFTFLEDGTLHLKSMGSERFMLQAFLQLNDQSSKLQVFPVPRVIWELVATPHVMGSRPMITPSNWNVLPHINHEGWSSDTANEKCRAYTSKDERYRYFVVYHSPAYWDASRDVLLNAWGEILDTMKGTNFMQKKCRELFVLGRNS